MQDINVLHQAIEAAEAAESAAKAERNKLNASIYAADATLNKAAEAVEKAKAAMEDYLASNGLVQDSVQQGGFTVTYGWQKGRESVVVACKPEDLPPEYQRIKYEADKVKIKEAIESGARLNFATLQQGEKKLRITVKKTKTPEAA